jgi:hypothetical protein
MMRLAASLVALCLVSACGMFGGGGTTLPPPDYTQRVGADRQAPASGIAASRAKTRHDDADAPVDESRGQPIGSIVPRDQPSWRKAPPAAPAEPDAKL